MRLAIQMKTGQMKTGQVEIGSGQPGGLAGWLLVWLRTRERFARLVARLGQGRAAPRMELVEVLALGGKRQLLLVVCDGQRYLLGTGGDGVQTIVPIVRPPIAEVAAVNAEDVPQGQGGRVNRISLVARPGAEDLGCGS